MNTTLARRLGVLAAGALALSGLTVTGSSPAGAVALGADPAPAAASATWLTSQLKGNLLPFGGDQFINYGGTIDAALGLKTASVDTALQAAILTAVESTVTDYTGFDAGSKGKAAFYAQQYGRNARAFGGQDLITQLEPSIVNNGPSAGRLFEGDQAGDPINDYANVLSQSFAASALRTAASSKAAAAESFLLKQQCGPGYFTEQFAQADPAAANQSCVAGSTPSVDATALAALTLSSSPTAAAKAAAASSIAWLRSVQSANGSFNPTGTSTGGNASSTGYAGWALGAAGDTASAAKAALWIRGQQLANAGSCTSYAAADNGAVAQDAAAKTAVASRPIGASGTSVVDQFRVATAQTLGALAYAPGGAASGATILTADRFAKAGATGSDVVVSGAPGNTVCFTSGGRSVRQVLDAVGGATFALALPATEGAATASVTDAGGEVDAVAVRVLGKKKVKFAIKSARAVIGSKAVVKVRGLAAGERVIVKLRGKKVVTTASAKGKKNVKVKVTGKPGRAKLVVKGEYGNRSGKQVIRVVR